MFFQTELITMSMKGLRGPGFVLIRSIDFILYKKFTIFLDFSDLFDFFI